MKSRALELNWLLFFGVLKWDTHELYTTIELCTQKNKINKEEKHKLQY